MRLGVPLVWNVQLLLALLPGGNAGPLDLEPSSPLATLDYCVYMYIPFRYCPHSLTFLVCSGFFCQNIRASYIVQPKTPVRNRVLRHPILVTLDSTWLDPSDLA